MLKCASLVCPGLSPTGTTPRSPELLAQGDEGNLNGQGSGGPAKFTADGLLSTEAWSAIAKSYSTAKKKSSWNINPRDNATLEPSVVSAAQQEWKTFLDMAPNAVRGPGKGKPKRGIIMCGGSKGTITQVWVNVVMLRR